MTTITLHSSYLNFVNVSTYDGLFDIDYMYDWALSQMPSFIQIKETNWDAYTKAIMEYYMDAMWDNILGELDYLQGYDLESAKFYMPKAYNFANDSFSIDIQVDKDGLLKKLKEIVSKHPDTCKEFLHENWKSRDGFISFMPENIEELKKCDDLEKILAFVISIQYLLDGEREEYNFFAYDEMRGNTSIYDFVTFELEEQFCWDEYPLMQSFSQLTDREIGKYILDNNIATKSDIKNLIGATYITDVFEVLKDKKDSFNWDMELPIDDYRTAMFVVLWINEIEEIRL